MIGKVKYFNISALNSQIVNQPHEDVYTYGEDDNEILVRNFHGDSFTVNAQYVGEDFSKIALNSLVYISSLLFR